MKWALGSNLWNYFPRVPFTDILDVMKDTGFFGIRLTQFPGILKTYDITGAQLQAELSKRGLQVITISTNVPAHDLAQHKQAMATCRQNMDFLKQFGANRLVIFSPRRGPDAKAFKTMCSFYNTLGEVAGEMAFKAGLHNHLGQMVQTPEEIDLCMDLTNPMLFHFSPDTAHVHLGGGDAVKVIDKHKHRLMLADYKDAKREGLANDFRPNIYDLGDGEIDFPGVHRVLKGAEYQGWLCVDLDIARNGPRASYERCGQYIVDKLEPIYV
ncbi:MAG: TIM barrel protein [Acidobacteriaceae bacterium]|nr:TIM barrel protein [Acidobacteriaceae bacterium]